MKIKEYIDSQIAHGRCYFTIEDMHKKLDRSKNAINLSISRLLKKGEVISPVHGFYVIIPQEYRRLGCIPAGQFIPYLMEYLGHKYYAGLITAASYHGVAHHAPQVFKVITDTQLKSMACGRVRVIFVRNQDIKQTIVNWVSTPKSRLAVSSPEYTAADLVRFVKQSGGINNVVTILAELHEKMTEERLRSMLETVSGIPWKQRLGYILEFVGAQKLAKVVKEYLSTKARIDYAMLVPGSKKNLVNAKRDQAWKIIVNYELESDV